MKFIARIILVALVALMAMTAFAADASTTTKFDLNLTNATTFAGVTLQPGAYKVFVDRTGDSAKVRIAKGGKDVVNTTAKFKQVEKMQTELSLALDPARNVSELNSAKLKGTLLFDGAPAAPPANGGK